MSLMPPARSQIRKLQAVSMSSPTMRYCFAPIARFMSRMPKGRNPARMRSTSRSGRFTHQCHIGLVIISRATSRTEVATISTWSVTWAFWVTRSLRRPRLLMTQSSTWVARSSFEFEVIVEGPEADIGAVGDLLDGRAVDAILRHDLVRRAQQPHPRLQLARSHAGRVHLGHARSCFNSSFRHSTRSAISSKSMVNRC